MECVKKVILILTMLSLPVLAKDAEVTDVYQPKNYPAQYTAQYISKITPMYKVVGKDEIFYVALDMLKNTSGDFSRLAILGNNLTEKPVKIEFKNLGEIV